jgi:RNA polymerase sigma factor (sigma-70 family)
MASSHDIVSDPFTVTFIRVKAGQLIKRSDFSSSDFDELQQDMRLYLLEKAHLFDPDRGNLESFVTKAVNSCVGMMLRHQDCLKRREDKKAVSLERTMVEHEGEISELGYVLLEDDGQRRTRAYPRSDFAHFELNEAVEHVMAKLDPDDRDLLLSIAEHGLKETARRRGVSWRQVTNARDRLRKEFEKAGLGRE